ncbi:D-TA family PLP-dependent enzyme [Arthrobacter sp. ISL-28]|uniref:D-TA family PLP-dependent enzyme n=1 Tax=Arthrobacter sp. ISL-28 TaxID=2819108 RepID=UPI001BE67CB8|nr:D-TA family PLP-dependent enzyme [Arthrobacter sp. ISL-28]MBT2520692.1 D-TA family PLP-dependent enzyme [Arthrobacter sp. ISL-28]
MTAVNARGSGSQHLPLTAVIPPELTTPEVMIDVDVLDRNIARMASATQARGLRLRPHAKTHKVLEIADRQLAAGALGLTVATIGEAEVFAKAGVRDIFIAYPLWVTAPQAARLRNLAQASSITVGVDSAESASFMGKNLGSDAGRIAVLVELDSGHHRSGVRPVEAATVARAAAAAGLDVAGVFTFPGHSYAPGMPTAAARQEDEALRQGADGLEAAGFRVKTISGGSTPTAGIEGDTAATELRPGVYVFGDAQQLELQRCVGGDIALTVASTVVSHHRTGPDEPGRFIIDAGSKVLGSDRPGWASGYGRLLDYPDATITALSEHHATVQWPQGTALPGLGDRLRVIPNHVCLTMNLVDEVSVVSNGALTGRWTVAARGKNS